MARPHMAPTNRESARQPAAPLRLPPQRMGFTFAPEALPRSWFNTDPVLTHFRNALSISFPEGEQFFADSVRHFRDVVKDKERQQEISGCIGQEAMHSLEHRSFNAMLAAQGPAWPGRAMPSRAICATRAASASRSAPARVHRRTRTHHRDAGQRRADAAGPDLPTSE